MDKLKEFFKNKYVRIVCWILWILTSIVLLIGGVTEKDFSRIEQILVGIISSVAALIAIIGELLNDKK